MGGRRDSEMSISDMDVRRESDVSILPARRTEQPAQYNGNQVQQQTIREVDEESQMPSEEGSRPLLGPTQGLATAVVMQAVSEALAEVASGATSSSPPSAVSVDTNTHVEIEVQRDGDRLREEAEQLAREEAERVALEELRVLSEKAELRRNTERVAQERARQRLNSQFITQGRGSVNAMVCALLRICPFCCVCNSLSFFLFLSLSFSLFSLSLSSLFFCGHGWLYVQLSVLPRNS